MCAFACAYVIVPKDGLTPLHCAARSGHDPAVELLLERGAPILARTKVSIFALVYHLEFIQYEYYCSFLYAFGFYLGCYSLNFLPPYRMDCLHCTCQPRETT